MVPGRFSWLKVGFHGFSWFQVGFSRFQVRFHVFHGSRLVFHVSRLVFLQNVPARTVSWPDGPA